MIPIFQLLTDVTPSLLLLMNCKTHQNLLGVVLVLVEYTSAFLSYSLPRKNINQILTSTDRNTDMRFKDKRILSIRTTDDMLKILDEKGNPLSSFKKGVKIQVYNKMEQGYSYLLTENPGQNLQEDFQLTPAQMLELGVFEGKYLNDCLLEFPKEWFLKAIKKGKLSPQGANPEVNLFGVKSRLNLDEWESYGWVPNKENHTAKQYPLLSSKEKNNDIRGWFQWYCRYWMGRREPEMDTIQLKRWRAFRRHLGQIKANCKPGDLSCRPIQRQSLTQWAYKGDI